VAARAPLRGSNGGEASLVRRHARTTEEVLRAGSAPSTFSHLTDATEWAGEYDEELWTFPTMMTAGFVWRSKSWAQLREEVGIGRGQYNFWGFSGASSGWSQGWPMLEHARGVVAYEVHGSRTACQKSNNRAVNFA
jgi:hypothetical protein